MPRRSNNDRNQALGMLRAGISTREVARLFNCHQSTVVRLRQRFQTTNNVSDRPRPGQPRVTTDQQDRHIRLQHLRNRFKTAVSTARETQWRHNPRISSASASQTAWKWPTCKTTIQRTTAYTVTSPTTFSMG